MNEARITEKLESMLRMSSRASALFPVARLEYASGTGDEPSDAMLALERALYCAAQDALDLAAMLLKDSGWRDPLTYGASAAALADLGIVSREQAEGLIGLAGLRNRLAHDYGALDRERLLGFEAHMEDFNAFARSVVAHLDHRGPEPQ